MIITVSLMGIITSVILFAWAQIMKYVAKRLNVSFISDYLPIFILVISYIVYLIMLRDVLSPIINALFCTALCCFAYDLYASVKTLVLTIISKIRTKSGSNDTSEATVSE